MLKNETFSTTDFYEQYIPLVTILIFLNLLDVLITAVGVQLQMIEANPLFSSLVMHDMRTAIILKFVLTFIYIVGVAAINEASNNRTIVKLSICSVVTLIVFYSAALVVNMTMIAI